MRVIQRVDDVCYAKYGTQVVAPHIVKLSWQVDGGKVRTAELDLSEENLMEYGDPVEELLEIYEKNNPKLVIEDDFPVPRVEHPLMGSPIAVAKRYGAAVRKFADHFNIRRLDGIDRPAYETPTGGFYKPRWLETAYDYWVETGEVVLPRPSAVGENQEGDENLHSDRAAGRAGG